MPSDVGQFPEVTGNGAKTLFFEMVGFVISFVCLSKVDK